jgi:hypothetical protein
MRSRDFAVLVCNRIEEIGVCLFCDEYHQARVLMPPASSAMAPVTYRQHAPGCIVAEYLRTESTRRNDKTQRDRVASRNGPTNDSQGDDE